MTTGQQFDIRERIAKQLRQIMQVAKDNDIVLNATTPHTPLAVVLDNLATDLEGQSDGCCFPEFWKKSQEKS